MKELRIQNTLCRHGQPLVVVRNLPGEDAEMRPEQLRALAKALIRAADIAESGSVSLIRSKNEINIPFTEL